MTQKEKTNQILSYLPGTPKQLTVKMNAPAEYQNIKKRLQRLAKDGKIMNTNGYYSSLESVQTVSSIDSDRLLTALEDFHLKLTNRQIKITLVLGFDDTQTAEYYVPSMGDAG
jgi:hypothetical protein